MTEALLTKKEAALLVRWHPEHLMRESRAGRFVQPFKLGSSANCRVLFAESEVRAFIADRMSARRNG